MKRTILVILMLLFTMFLGAVDATAAEKENTDVVKAVFKALKTKDQPMLDKLMAPEPAKHMKHWLAGFIRQLTDYKIKVGDIFASGQNVAARWTLLGEKDRMLGKDWTVNFVCVFQVADNKVTDMWLGEDMQREMLKHGFKLVPPAPESLEGKLKATMGDIHVIGRAIANYLLDMHHAPKAGTIKETAKFIQPFYIETCPLEDAWGNDLIYKIDPKNPKNYWIASPGSDGKFAGFHQKGTWSSSDDKGQDIVLYNGNFQYSPEMKKK